MMEYTNSLHLQKQTNKKTELALSVHRNDSAQRVDFIANDTLLMCTVKLI